ncbi:MAG: orotidine 5'-phosphate decarboxylase / HUMPS family protein [Candidatus Bathyarchaeia archaeon]
MADQRQGLRLRGKGPTIWVTIDTETIPEAVAIGRRALAAGAHWLEAGTPLISSEGIKAIEALVKTFGGSTIVADFKTVDGGDLDVEMAARAGAHVVTVMAVAEDATILKAVETARKHSLGVIADVLGAKEKPKRAREVAELGVDGVFVHTGFDERRLDPSRNPLIDLAGVLRSVQVPVAVGGGITSEVANKAVEMGAQIVVVSTTTGVSPFEMVIKSVLDRHRGISFRRI